jgi:hypothetical protein
MSIVDLIALSLATSHAIEVWNHGSIFAGARSYWETNPHGEFLSDLLSCMFCLSLWVGSAGVILWSLAQAAGSSFLMLPVYALAITRGANLVNDLTRQWCRTPDRSDDDLPET